MTLVLTVNDRLPNMRFRALVVSFAHELVPEPNGQSLLQLSSAGGVRPYHEAVPPRMQQSHGRRVHKRPQMADIRGLSCGGVQLCTGVDIKEWLRR